MTSKLRSQISAARVFLAGNLLLALVGTALAQGDGVNRKRIFERDPFDRITCTKAFNGEVIEIKPIPFPGRKIPADHKPGDKLKVQRLDEEQPYEIPWVSIDKLELFEQMVLA